MEEEMSQDGAMRRGLLAENPLFTLLLGLCPALAVSTRVADALVLSLGVLFVLPGAALLARPTARIRREGLRAFVSAMAVAALVTVFDVLAGSAFAIERERLGIYVPILAANCLLLGRMGMYARWQGEGDAFPDAVGMGLGFAASLLVISALREVLGSGRITLFPMGGFDGVLTVAGLSQAPARLLVLPAGGLIVLGYLVALRRALRGGRTGGRA
jgi:Na+-translocating ferredoxin:NAD+ oxidoreductase subunit E